jgi:mannose-6-phosphate isomerase-like protein (cupin superfamily)
MSYPEPKYHGATGEVTAVVTPADAEPDLLIGKGTPTGGPTDQTRVTYLATGASTKGEFGLYKWEFGTAVTGPDPHFHRTVSESFYVLSGTVRLFDGKQWTDGGPGDYLFVPEGGIHGFRNESGERASMLLMFAPGAPREGYFEGLAEWAVSDRRPSEEEYAEFMLRHDNHWV